MKAAAMDPATDRGVRAILCVPDEPLPQEFALLLLADRDHQAARADSLAAAVQASSETTLTHAQMLTWIKREGRRLRAGPTRSAQLLDQLNRRLDDETAEHIKTSARAEVAEARNAAVIAVMRRMAHGAYTSIDVSLGQLRVALGLPIEWRDGGEG